MNEPTTTPRRVADGMRCCTVHIPLEHHRELTMLALEDSTATHSLTYADELRCAILEYIQQRRSNATLLVRQIALEAVTEHADNADCPKCRSIIDTNAATLAKPTRARASKPTRKPAKKGRR